MLTDSRIGFRLTLGFLIILLILISVTLFALNRMDVLSEQTENIYNHPLTVSNAVLRINANIIKMHRAMKDVTLSYGEEHLREDAQLVDELENEVLEDFEIINQRFLGKKETHETALNLFKAWKPIRDEVVTLMLNGEVRQAIAITRGKGARHVEKIEESMEALGDFAQRKARGFLDNAAHTKDLSFNTMYFVLVIALILTIVFALYLTASITTPLSSIKETVEAIGSGDINARIRIKSKDELGELASTFNLMMDNLSEVTASRDELNNEIEERRKAELLLERKSHDLGERVKELNCLYALSKLIEAPGLSLEDIYIGLIDIIPPSWQYPEITCARIAIGEKEYLSNNYRESQWNQSSEIKVHGVNIGILTVNYLEKMPEIDEGPFMMEERALIDALAAKLGRAVESSEAQATIKAALKDKEVLLKEVHHRVKNNLAVIQSLLSLQVKDISDEKSKGYFIDAENRVKSMTMIHEMLHSSGDVSKLNTTEYIRNLVATLFRNYKVQPNYVKLNIDVQDINLDVDTMIPLGLIINELVSNALKYAFPDEMKGELTVSLKTNEEGIYELLIKDTGVGLPEGFDHNKSKSLGLLIVNSLVDQLSGTLKVSSKDGAEFRMTFAERCAV